MIIHFPVFPVLPCPVDGTVPGIIRRPSAATRTRPIMRSFLAILLLVLPAMFLFPEKIVVRQDRSGKIVVSNVYTGHNYITPKSKRVQFVGSRGAGKVPQRYLVKIRKLSKKYGVKESLIVAVARAESSFNPFAVSKKGAVGIMQLMPGTARDYGVRNRYNVDQNLEAGVRHLKYLYNKYKSIPLTLAAYNAGEKAVAKYKGVPPYKETQTYVKRVMKYMGMRYSRIFGAKSNSRKRIYKIVSSSGKVVITDTLPSRIDGELSIID